MKWLYITQIAEMLFDNTLGPVIFKYRLKTGLGKFFTFLGVFIKQPLLGNSFPVIHVPHKITNINFEVVAILIKIVLQNSSAKCLVFCTSLISFCNFLLVFSISFIFMYC